ncbi:MAG: MFS transporter [Actinomycetes bacterium]
MVATPAVTSLSPRAAWAALASVCVPLFAICVNTTAINTALPAIADELDASLVTLQWVVNGYILAAAAFVVPGGQLGDVLGRRRVMLAGAAVFAASSLVVALAPNPSVLVAGRVLQGVGSAFLLPGTMSIAAAALGPARRTMAVSLWAAVAGLGIALGPLFGGLLAATVGWRWVWWLNLPVMALTVVLCLAYVPDWRDRARRLVVDVPGIVLLALGSLALVVFLTEASDWGWTSPVGLGVLAAGVILLVAFVRLERRRADPLVHLELLRVPAFLGANVGTLASNVVLIGGFYLFNLFLQSLLLLDLSPAEAGVALLPLNGAYFALSLVAGPLGRRYGTGPVAAAGFVLLGAGSAWLSLLDVGFGYADVWPPFVVLGLGLGLTIGPTSAAGVVAVERNRAGEASGMVNMSRYLGGVLGVAVLAVVYADVALSRLNTILGGRASGEVEERRLDRLLTAAPGDGAAALRKLDPSLRRDYLDAAPTAVLDGFVWSARACVVASLVGLASAFLLPRVRHHVVHKAAKHPSATQAAAVHVPGHQ